MVGKKRQYCIEKRFLHRVLGNTEFSAYKAKGISASRQYFLSLALNKAFEAWSVYYDTLALPFSSVLPPACRLLRALRNIQWADVGPEL